MRKVICTLGMVAAVVAAVASVPSASAASNCRYKCSCSGSPLYCCINSTGTESCKPAGANSPIQCPQVYNC